MRGCWPFVARPDDKHEILVIREVVKCFYRALLYDGGEFAMTTLKRKILLARLALFWERLWPALFPAALVVGVFLLAALTGLLELLPQLVHTLVLAGFCVALGFALRPLLSLRWPDATQALRYLETRANLPHRPASSYADTLDASLRSPETLGIWKRHKERLQALLKKLRPAWPVSRVRDRDPYALRAALVMCLVVAFLWSGVDAPERLGNAFTPTAKDETPVWLDAWIKPPEYTGIAPIFLSGQSKGTTTIAPGLLRVPQSSEIVIRLSGAKDASVSFLKADDVSKDAPADNLPLEATDDGISELRSILTEAGKITVRNADATLQEWQLDVIPDAPPTIEVVGEIETGNDQSLRFSYKVTDDYGVQRARAQFVLSDEQGDAEGVESGAVLMVDPPDFELTLPTLTPKAAEQNVFQDLTAHAWAGLVVEMTLIARDEAGNETESEKVVFRLPERVFTQPLARAVIEQRRKLLRDPDEHVPVARALSALTYYPKDLIKSAGVFLGIRHAVHRLVRSDDDVTQEVADLLWDIALSIEDGDLSLAERELRAAQRELQQALANDAPPEEIARLVENLRNALKRYMSAMAERLQRDPNAMQRAPEGAQQLRSQDLNNMLDTIENLARAGARDAAQNMLSQLQNMLENLQAGRMQQGLSESDQAMARMIEELGQMMQQQQELMDRTFQEPGGDQRNEPGANGPNRESNELARDQRSLAETLQELLDSLQQRGANPPSALGQAEESMRGAEGQLREGDRPGAVGNQAQALDQLRQGAQAMAEQLNQGMGTQGSLGRHGEGGNDPNRDPLGRPMQSSGGNDLGLSTKVPSDIEIQRARQILRELQNRIGDRSRPQLELDYIERLLQRF